MAATLREAYQAKKCAMDQHPDADAAAVFEVHPADDWPYVRLTPNGGSTRATHEWMTANAARAKARQAERKAGKARKSGT